MFRTDKVESPLNLYTRSQARQVDCDTSRRFIYNNEKPRSYKISQENKKLMSA